jgi:5-methylcytosine-specific restriction endonuclease McrA
MDRVCPIDGVELNSTQKTYCSLSCSAKGTRSWTYKNVERRTWKCKVCGVTHRRKNSPYCSEEHKLEQQLQEVRKLLVVGKPKSKKLKHQLVRLGLLEAKCAWCGLTNWRGKTGLDGLLQLDHINGNAHDNRLENLRILCANCHTQTDTYCGRNKGNGMRK